MVMVRYPRCFLTVRIAFSSRLIPASTSLAYIYDGPCVYLSGVAFSKKNKWPFACAGMVCHCLYTVMLVTLSQSLFLIASSFAYRMYILGRWAVINDIFFSEEKWETHTICTGRRPVAKPCSSLVCSFPSLTWWFWWVTSMKITGNCELCRRPSCSHSTTRTPWRPSWWDFGQIMNSTATWFRVRNSDHNTRHKMIVFE